jgi:ATP-dependent Clp protease ATP-binding subunit ClpA
MGARPLARVIQEKIKKNLAEELLFGELRQGGSVYIDFDGKDLTFVCKADKDRPKTSGETFDTEIA